MRKINNDKPDWLIAHLDSGVMKLVLCGLESLVAGWGLQVGSRLRISNAINM
jgi:hypothetical protein